MKKQLFAILCCLSVLPAHAGFDLDPAVAGTLSPNKATAKAAAEAPAADAATKADAIAMLTEAKKTPSVAAQGDTTKSSPPSSIAPTGAGTPAPVTPSLIRDWQIKPSDLTIYATLRRWAKEAGAKLLDSDDDRLKALCGTHRHQGVVARVSAVSQARTLDEVLGA